MQTFRPEVCQMSSDTCTVTIPKDLGRWKTTKSAEEARAEITKTLRNLDIAHNEDNWSKWERYFNMLVNSLELSTFIFGDMRAPTTRTDLQIELAGGDASRFDSKLLPHLYRDVVGKIFHRDRPEVEIVNEEEKRRFDSNMMLVYGMLDMGM